MDTSRKMHGKPRKIISVRGPRTRNFLIERGISCPEHYGDPALLLPVFYQPECTRKEAVSLVPHIDTLSRNCPIIDELTEKYGYRLVNMTRYDKWTDIIDSIVSSEFVISESLHGLIVAESYGIPSVWTELIDHTNVFNNDDWSFKFIDFYESIGKYGMSSLKLYECFSFEEILKAKDKWKPGKINYAELLSLFPFEIKAEFLPRIKKFLA